ncbi:uncharacterized protein LOC135686339 isoform X1 [Rhopilema esculentum]|uniref:uncharacterized protein LOC135686339 isoform X1 n=1 Tax=Rhopilema esculentum TaxID=499914 RepID=UPI0031E418DD
MIRSKKSSARPEITIVDVRPLNQSPLNNEPFPSPRSIYSPTESNHSGNGFAFATLPSSTGLIKKQRPKSEIYNGFNSLRSMKATKVDEEQLRKESKKVSRSKSLHAPKKPPRELPLRQAPTPPSLESNETKDQAASISPSRPAPPIPMLSFNKKGPASKPTTTSVHQNEESKENMRRIRSKSTSTVGEKSKARGPSTLPRGRSFNNHGQRQLIKTTQEENVVILTRSNSVEEKRERDVKLKSFGTKASKPINGHLVHEQVGTTVSCESKGAAITEDTNVYDPHEDTRTASVGSVTLSDAIQANAVYARLQIKNEELTSVEPDKVKQDEQLPSPVLSLNDAINSSPVLAKLKEKQKEFDESVFVDNEIGKSSKTAESYKDSKPEVFDEVHSIPSDDSLRQSIEVQGQSEAGKVVTDKERTKSRPNGVLNAVKPVAKYVVQTEKQHRTNKDASGDALNGGVALVKPGIRRMSAPPAVKPKPSVPRRPSLGKQRSFDEGKENEVNNLSKKFPGSVQSEEIINRISTKITLKENLSEEGLSENKLKSDLNNKDFSESLKSEGDSISCKPSVVNRTMSDSKHIINFDKKVFDKTVLTRTKSESRPNGRNDTPDDSVFDEMPLIPRTKSESRPGKEDKAAEGRLSEAASLPRTQSESEPESSGSVDSLSSLTSQITVIFNGETSAKIADVGAAAGAQVPYQSNSSQGMQKTAPEPYSSHPGRRPKPGKPAPVTATTKARNRKSRSIKGRRLTSSPPSTPPPPPKMPPSDAVSKVATNCQPPVPPRAPSMYVQSDLRSLDSMMTSNKLIDKEIKSPPPPRPAKPPSAAHSLLITKAKNSLQNNGVKTNTARDDADTKGPENEAVSRDTDESQKNTVLNADLKPCDSNLIQKRTVVTQSNEAPIKHIEASENFSQKLEFFESTTEKPTERRPPAIHGKANLEHGNPLDDKIENSPNKTTEEVRREGQEALAFVWRLKRENSETKVETRKKSPAPQKPKRPLSFSMENFVFCESVTTDKNESPEVNVQQIKKAPPKPGRSLASFKALSLDEGAKEDSNSFESKTVKQVDLRSADTTLYENLKPENRKKVTPKKPVRTSSLKVKGTSKIIYQGGNSVQKRMERKTIENREECCNEEDVVSKSGSTINSLPQNLGNYKDKEILSDNMQNSITEEDTQRAVCSEETDGPGPDHCEFQNKRDIPKENPTEINDNNNRDIPYSPSKTNEATNTLSSQIEELDKILLETSTVLSESFRSMDDSFCTQQNSFRNDNLPVVNSCSEDPFVRNIESLQFDSGLCNLNSSEAGDSNADVETAENTVNRENIVEKKSHIFNKIYKKDIESNSAIKIVSSSLSMNTTGKITDNSEGVNSASGKCTDIVAAETDELVGFSQNKKGSCSKRDTEKTDSEETEIAKSIEIQCRSGDGEPVPVNSPSDQTFTDKKSSREIPVKPPRPKSFPKVINASCVMNSAQSERKKVPPRPIGFENSPVKENRARRKSAPARPDAPVVSYRSRPPIPAILREDSNDSECDNVPKPHAIALYDRKTSDTKDLTFSAGDLISLEFQVNADWFFGSVGTKRGMVPVNHMNVVVPLESKIIAPCIEKELLTLDRPLALAVHPFVADNEKELTFQSGDAIELLSEKSNDWLEGRCNGRTGIFPSSFVVVVKSLPPRTSDNDILSEKTTLNQAGKITEKILLEDPSHSGPVNFREELPVCLSDEDWSGRLCMATSDFVSDSKEALNFKTGQTIRIISREENGWLRGTLFDTTGLFPQTFVQILDEYFDAGVQNRETENGTEINNSPGESITEEKASKHRIESDESVSPKIDMDIEATLDVTENTIK